MDWQTSEDTVPSAFITEANRRAMRGTPPTTGAWREGDPVGERLFHRVGTIELESGAQLPHARLAYETWGELHERRDNAVLIMHALTGDSHVVGKPGAGLPAEQAFADLASRIKAAGRARVRPGADRAPAHAASGDFRPDGRIVAIGSSTGGVEALLTVLAAFPANCPPTVITQHMPGSFTRSFAERLNRTCAARVGEAYEGAPLDVGQVWLAPGGESHLQVAGNLHMRCRLVAEPPVNGHRPSVDVLFESVAKVAGRASLGVILTGMGRDGAKGLLSMREAGASTIGQNEATSVVYGMPKVAQEIGAVERQLPLERIGAEIVNRCNQTREAV